MKLSKAKVSLPFLIGLITGLWFFNLNVTGTDLALSPGDLGDARFVNYVLEHNFLFFSGREDSFWNAPFLYPEANVITYSENLLGASPFYAFFRMVGVDLQTSFQLWFIVISALNYTACYFLLLHLFKNKYAAVLGAMVFAFSMGLQSQMAHAQTFTRFAIPLTFWMGVLYLKELKPQFLFAMLFFLVYQFYCCLYLGFMLFIPVAVFLSASVIIKFDLYVKRARLTKWYLGVIAALVSAIVLLLPIILPYMERASQMDLYPYEKVVQSVPTIRSFFYSYYGSFFWNFLKATGEKYEAYWDHRIFCGGVAMLSFIAFVVIVSLKMWRKKALPKIVLDENTRILFITAICTVLFFIRFQGYSLYSFIHVLPGFGSMRALQRIVNIELVFFAIATAFIFSLVFRKQFRFTNLLFVGFVILVYADNHIHPHHTGHYDKAESESRIQLVKEKIKEIPEGTVISYEPDSLNGAPIFVQLDAMLAAQSCGLKTLNGYTSNSPDEYSFYWESPNEYGRLKWLNKNGISPDRVRVVH